MIIHKPQLTVERGEIRLSARIDVQTPGIEVPDTLWYTFPRHYHDYVTDRTDAFVVGLLPTAMSLGENMVVKGSVSPRLAWGIREYQRVQHAWWRQKFFSIVDIEYEHLEAPAGAGAGAVGCSVSGGVDSFYTLWSHMPANETIPGYALTHGLIINGFDYDTDLKETGRFRRTMEAFKPVVERAGMELLTSRNNLRQFRLAAPRRATLAISYDAPIAASVLVLGKLFSRFYLPGSGSYGNEKRIPIAPEAITFPLFSTEGLQIIADGHDASRAEKTTTIAQWPETHTTLRVCWRDVVFNETTGLIENCCRCQKCVRTMLALDLVGALRKYQTFPSPLKRRDVWRTKSLSNASAAFLNDNLELARKVGRRDRVIDLNVARMRSYLQRIIRRLRRPVRRQLN